MTRRLVARLDNAGDVLLCGPAVRAMAASGGAVTMLTGPAGAAAARLLPGVDEVRTVDAPWVALDPSPATPEALRAVAAELADIGADEAVVLTSFHQSPLPLALMLRQAGVGSIAATSVDYPGSLLDVRHRYIDQLHEVEQALSVCQAAGHHLPDADDGRLLVDLPAARIELPSGPYVAIHPGASVPARALPVRPTIDAIAGLHRAGYRAVITAGPSEQALAHDIADAAATPDTTVLAEGTALADLGHVLAGATAVICGNTGPAHLAAAVGTPVVQAFAPTVDPRRWHPWMVPHVLLGTLDISCAGCRASTCPVPDQPCLHPFTADAVVGAVATLAATRREAVA